MSAEDTETRSTTDKVGNETLHYVKARYPCCDEGKVYGELLKEALGLLRESWGKHQKEGCFCARLDCLPCRTVDFLAHAEERLEEMGR